jgi:hypothetical protein
MRPLVAGSFRVNNSNFIVGDINLDVLQYVKNGQVTEYIDLFFSFSLLQAITKPSRIANKSATIIDHVKTSSPNLKHKSIILTSKLSDHFPNMYFPNIFKKPSGKPELIESRDFF